MTRAAAVVVAGAILLLGAPAFACDTTGRLDVFGLADRADSVFVGAYVGDGAFTLTTAIAGTPVLATQLRGGPRSECAPTLQPNADYLVLVAHDGSAIGAYRSAVPVTDTALVQALRDWLATSDPGRRRRVLARLVASDSTLSAREGVFALARSGWWRARYARELAPDRCRALRSALEDFDVEWNRTGLRRRVQRDFERACPP